MLKFEFRFVKRIPFYHDKFFIFNHPPRLILPETALPAIITQVGIRLQFHAFRIKMPHLALAVFANVLRARSATPGFDSLSSATSVGFRL